MHSATRRFKVLGFSSLAGLMLLSGCASKKYVREQMATVDPKITDVRNQTRENAERIDAVDKRAQQGIADAAAANKAAQAANAAAGTAQKAAQAAQTSADAAGKTATTATTGVAAADKRITQVESRFGTLDRYTAGPVQTVVFKVGSSALDDAAKQALDRVAGQVTGLPGGFMVEIQGFASAEGQETKNVMLSQDRAESVARYLVGKNVPLFRIAMVGLGVEKPVGDNTTKPGREQNRRVELRVLQTK